MRVLEGLHPTERVLVVVQVGLALPLLANDSAVVIVLFEDAAVFCGWLAVGIRPGEGISVVVGHVLAARMITLSSSVSLLVDLVVAPPLMQVCCAAQSGDCPANPKSGARAITAAVR